MRKGYFGIVVRPNSIGNKSVKNRFSKDDTLGTTLGDKIRSAQKYGANLGTSVPVSYDDPNDEVKGVDVLASPNHDLFDIAEEFGRLVDSSSAPLQGSDEPKGE